MSLDDMKVVQSMEANGHEANFLLFHDDAGCFYAGGSCFGISDDGR